MNWLILTIASAVLLSISRVMQRVMLKRDESDSYAFSFIFPVLVSLVIFLYAIVTGSMELPNLRPVFFNVVLMIVLYSVGSVCVYEAYKRSLASEVSIIFASSSVWSVMSAVIFLKESLLTKNIIGIISMVIGIIVINYQKSSWKIESGHIYAIVGALFFGVAFTNDAIILRQYHAVPPYVFIAFVLPALAILLYRPSLVSKLPYFFSARVIGKMLLTASLYALSAIALYTAYRFGGQASVITPLQQLSVVLTVILSYIFLGERSKLWQKTVGVSLAVLGALLLI